MNGSDARKTKIAQDRNQILDSLKMIYPSPMQAYVLRRSILSQPEWDVFRKDIAYLVGKGYVEEVKPEAVSPYPKRWFQLTPAGVETADGLLNDPALDPEV